MRWLVVVAFLGGCDVVWRIDEVPDPPGPQPIVGRWSSVAGGNAHTCAIDLDGQLFCWGLNSNGELGRESTKTMLLDVGKVGGDRRWLQVTSTYVHTCALGDDESVWCWGNNLHGALGDGTSGNISVAPKLVSGSWRRISAGLHHTCGIRTDDTLWCWGSNASGELGNGTTTPGLEPALVAAAGPWREVSAGVSATCAIDMDRSLWCWGSNHNGQIGDGTFSTAAEPLPRKIGTDTWTAVEAHNAFACGITALRKLRCWGFNGFGQLAEPPGPPRPMPIAVLLDGVDRTDWTDISAGSHFVCARTSEQRVFCWGNSTRGQSGTDGMLASAPFELLHEGGWLGLGAGVSHSCLIANDRTMWCFGADGYGQLGDGGTGKLVPTRVPGTWRSVSTRDSHTCALDLQGNLYCGGENSDGQLGTSSKDSQQSLVLVESTSSSEVTVGSRHTCAVRGGDIWCWGANASGQLGNGTFVPSNVAIRIRAGARVSATEHTCGIDGGAFVCWGKNTSGQVGNGGATASVPAPYRSTTSTWTTIATGAEHTCMIGTSGAVSCCGGNAYSQLGTNDAVNRDTPTPINLTAGQLSLGVTHSCAIQTSGDAFCWGANYDGQLGSDLPQVGRTPQPLPFKWRQLAAGGRHTCGIRDNGTLWCWGNNDHGQLGVGSRDAHKMPMQVGSASWTSVAAGTSYTCGITADDELFCWGDNSNGALVNGEAWRTVPILVP